MIDKYKSYLDENTYDALGYEDASQSRYESFRLCLDHLSSKDNPEILELGTSRSFVGGAFEGCNSDDPKYWNPNDHSKWDWGAGFATFIFGNVDGNLTTVDIVDAHIKRCKTMTDSLGIKCNHVVSDSITYLKNINKQYDLIYLDTGDMWPIEPSINLQLAEAMAIVDNNLLKNDGFILIDDVKNKTPRELGDTRNTLGKSEKSIPYFLSKKFNLIYTGYQYILQK